MKVARVAWSPVRVPFVRPFGTARGRPAHRDALLLTLTVDDGCAGWGEASPWPLFDQGDIADAARVFGEIAPQLIGLAIADVPLILADLDLARHGAPAASCAFDLAWHDLLGRAQDLTTGRLLGGTATRIPVNAVIGADTPTAAAAAARKAVAAGFGCIKLKVAVGALADDEARVAAVRAAIGPETRLRLDANGGWTPAAASTAIARLARYDLELVEQPVPAGDLAGLARVRRSVATPIAADEAVRDLDSARRVAELGAADLLVIKPMTVGGLRAGKAILDLAVSAGLRALVTTTIDFGLGIAGALHLATCLPAPTRHCGLATACSLLTDLTHAPLPVRGGAIGLPTVPGLGVTIDETMVRRYAAGPTVEVA